MRRKKDSARLEYKLAKCSNGCLASEDRATVCLMVLKPECHRCSGLFASFAAAGFWEPAARELYALETSDKAVVRAILRLYLRQRSHEVSIRETTDINEVGWNVPDGHVFTEVAEWIVGADLLGYQDRDQDFADASHALAQDYLENGYDPERHRVLVGARLEQSRARLYKYAKQLASLGSEVGIKVA